MIFKLACGDVMPGCDATFEHPTQEALFHDVAAHAAHSHGITTITPEVEAAVAAQVRQYAV